MGQALVVMEQAHVPLLQVLLHNQVQGQQGLPLFHQDQLMMHKVQVVQLLLLQQAQHQAKREESCPTSMQGQMHLLGGIRMLVL